MPLFDVKKKKKKKNVQYKELNFSHYRSRDGEISNKDKYTEGAQMHGLSTLNTLTISG